MKIFQTTSSPVVIRDWYRREARQLLSDFSVTPANGLTKAQVREGQEVHGPNKLETAKPYNFFYLLLSQLKSPMLYLLAIAGAVSFIFAEPLDGWIILFILLFNALLGAYQEHKAQRTFFALARLLANETSVTREGKHVLIPSSELVPGDIVVMGAGDRVPADLRIVESDDLKVDESALTGESLPIEKTSDLMNEEGLAVPEQVNMLWSGTHVVHGSVTALVVATGTRTYIGKLSEDVSRIDTEVPLQRGVRRLAYIVLAVVIVVAGILLLSSVFSANSLTEMVRVAVSLLVSVVPEGLPVVLMLILATGVRRMSREQVLVKRLHAVEALGHTNILAVDKTGTLTKNELVVQEILTDAGLMHVTGDGYEVTGELQLEKSPVDIGDFSAAQMMAKYAGLSANATVFYNDDVHQVVGDPTEAAMRVFGEKFDFEQSVLRADHQRLDELPFDHEKKYYASLFDIDGAPTMIQAGAGEVLVAGATHIHTDRGVQKLTEVMKKTYLDQVHHMSDRGLRVIGLSYKESKKSHITHDDIESMVFVGFMAMRDTLRREVPDALARAKDAGMRVVMITGDHVTTATAIAREAGIYHEGDVVLAGKDIEGLTLEELAEKLENVTVFARVTPEHKMAIIDAYQLRGDTIAMTGDGVNDAPSLVAADLGVAMGKVGTEVSKEAADIILLEDHFGDVPLAVAEGRHMYRSIQKVLVYLFSTNFAEMVIIVLAVTLLLPLPLTPPQIIWLNIVTDGFLVMALGLAKKEPGLMKQAFGKATSWLLKMHDVQQMLLMALTMVAGSLGIFFWAQSGGYVYATTMTLTTLAVFQWFNAWNVRSRDSIFTFNIFKGSPLLLATLFVVMLQILAIYVPFLQNILGTMRLNWSDWLLTVAVAGTVIVVEEVRKWWMRRG